MRKNILDEKVVVLRSQGWSMPRIARHYNVSTVAVYLYFKRKHSAFLQPGTHVRAEGDCDICGRPGQLDSDHDHMTGKNRGLLCRQCNQLLGDAQDKRDILLAAVQYLDKWEEA